jgi:CubicO group peptidase (beta-lactamase class C family)
MKDATFYPTEAQRARLARPFPNGPLTGNAQTIKLLNTPTKFDCAGGCSFATVADYVPFGQMLLNGGELDGQRILSPKTVHHMTSNHLGPEIKNNVARRRPASSGNTTASRSKTSCMAPWCGEPQLPLLGPGREDGPQA